jgi:asparagine synthase (glutamine-hydrolysing)
MCGIAGILEFNPEATIHRKGMENAVHQLFRRGPDRNGFYLGPGICLGHTRLCIIDTSEAASQPFSDPSGRYTLIFNGEIYNFRQLRRQLEQQGIKFISGSDTEVLLHWLITHGSSGLEHLQGFFAFALFDSLHHSLLLARDRFGIKPLLYYPGQSTITFASEMKALTAMGIPRKLDMASLELYLQLNYIPAPWSIFRDVHKLMPGHFMQIEKGDISIRKYYELELPTTYSSHAIPSYENAQTLLREKLESAVLKRLVADVPLGTFLSGGIDSSIITAMAARHKKCLNTFSIGFRDEPMFDETRYARLVARMHDTNHTEFSLTTDDLLGCLTEVLDYIDEPFADSSALAVYILSRETRRKVTVALSGDGADEMFGGYNKHMAEYKARQGGVWASALQHLHPMLKHFPQSRSHPVSNKIRQLYRFGKGMSLNPADRYWHWATMASQHQVARLLNQNALSQEAIDRKNSLMKHISTGGEFKEVLYTDMHLVLPNDMLTKVDLMSMANSLEVRVPFLDHDLVNWVFTLPEQYKIDRNGRKKILRDAFSDLLPPELYHRNKQGFEVPLLRWFRKELKGMITDDLLSDAFIRDQGIFHPEEVTKLRNSLFSSNPGDGAARIWALLVFQHWWKKNDFW